MKERRDRILDVAINLAEEGGFDNVRQRDVAESLVHCDNNGIPRSRWSHRDSDSSSWESAMVARCLAACRRSRNQ